MLDARTLKYAAIGLVITLVVISASVAAYFFGRSSLATELASVRAEASASTKTSRADAIGEQVALHRPDPSGTPDMTSWKTYEDGVVGFSVSYPDGWTVSSDLGPLTIFTANDREVAIWPTAFYVAWMKSPTSKDATPPQGVTCQRDNESIDSRAGASSTTIVDKQSFTLASGVTGLSYEWRGPWTLSYVLVAHNGYICQLVRPVSTESPFSKAEDATVWNILNSFQWKG